MKHHMVHNYDKSIPMILYIYESYLFIYGFKRKIYEQLHVQKEISLNAPNKLNGYT